MPLNVRDFETLERKLDLRTREGSNHRLAWFEYDGKVVTRTRRSRGSGDLPHSDAIRQQLKLNEKQLSGILNCSIERGDYIEILRDRGLLDEDEQNKK